MTDDLRTSTALNIHSLAPLTIASALCVNACTGVLGASGGVGVVSSSSAGALSVGRVGYLMLGRLRESQGALQGGGLLVTLSLRRDIEWRPAMQQSDVFVGLLAGISLPVLNRQ